MTSAWLAALFMEPIPIRGVGRLLMLLPLCLSISVVYKTLRCRNLREVPVAASVLCLTLVLGMMAIGVVLLLTFQLLA